MGDSYGLRSWYARRKARKAREKMFRSFIPGFEQAEQSTHQDSPETDRYGYWARRREKKNRKRRNEITRKRYHAKNRRKEADKERQREEQALKEWDFATFFDAQRKRQEHERKAKSFDSQAANVK